MSATATPRKANGANGKRENKEQTTPKPKNSIYKEKQPTGPVSAPLL